MDSENFSLIVQVLLMVFVLSVKASTKFKSKFINIIATRKYDYIILEKLDRLEIKLTRLEEQLEARMKVSYSYLTNTAVNQYREKLCLRKSLYNKFKIRLDVNSFI